MANLKPYKFTKQDSIKGGQASTKKRLQIGKINATLQDYLHGVGKFEGTSFVDDLLAINPKDRLNFLMAWMPFEIPKLQAVEQIIEVSKSDRSKEEIEKEIFAILEVNK